MERPEEPKRQVPPLGNSWAREQRGAREGNMKKDLKYWGVGGVDLAGDGEKVRRNKKGVGMESALKGVEDPFFGF